MVPFILGKRGKNRQQPSHALMWLCRCFCKNDGLKTNHSGIPSMLPPQQQQLRRANLLRRAQQHHHVIGMQFKVQFRGDMPG